jgi:carbon-monoxide dehydrogenase small subunit
MSGRADAGTGAGGDPGTDATTDSGAGTGAPPGALRVNGRWWPAEGRPDAELVLDTLRYRLGLKGTTEGCRSGGCGACTVLVDGVSVLSCLTLTREVEEAAITTVEGIADDPVGARVARAFLEESALQCGYCTPGFLVAVTGLLTERPDPTEAELTERLAGNLCRCTGYASIARALRRLLAEAAP